MSVDTPCRYEDDLLLWTQEQASVLREADGRGIDLPLDWDNLAEEIEGLGRSERRELGGFKWLSQHLDGGGCDEGWETTLGSGTTSRVAGVARPTRRGEA